MMRRTVMAAFAACVLIASLPGQQANTANATLTVNFLNHAAAGTGPINVSVFGGGSVVVTLRGVPLQRFILAGSTVITPGVAIPPYGTLDIFFPFTVVLDGFSPTTLFDLFALTNQTGVFQIAAAASVTPSLTNFALQAGIADPSAPGGARLTAASNVTISPFTGSTFTFNEGQLGDDVVVAYYHQGLSFPFYGTNYGRTFIDTNGYMTLGSAVGSQFVANAPAFLGEAPRIAPYWSDLHMSSVVPSAGNRLSVAPASIVVTESVGGGGVVSMQVDWIAASEAFVATVPPTPMVGNRFDFRCTLSSNGLINFKYGAALGAGFQVPASGNIVTIVGISPGSNLSSNLAARNLVLGTSVSPFTATLPNDAIFELFSITAGAFAIDLIGPAAGVSFQPQALTFPGSQVYSLF